MALIALLALIAPHHRDRPRPSLTRSLVPCAVRNAVVPPLVALLGAAALAACESDPPAARAVLHAGVVAMGRLLLEAAPPDARAAALAERDVCVRLPARARSRRRPGRGATVDGRTCADAMAEAPQEHGPTGHSHERTEGVAGEGTADSVGKGAGNGEAAIGEAAPRHVDAALQEGAPSEGDRPDDEEIVFEGRLAIAIGVTTVAPLPTAPP